MPNDFYIDPLFNEQPGQARKSLVRLAEKVGGENEKYLRDCYRSYYEYAGDDFITGRPMTYDEWLYNYIDDHID